MSAKKVADALAGVLADTYLLFTKTQNYHWNVVGPQFHQLHLLFEEQYNELFVGMDEIAERIRQIGFPSPGTLAEFLRLSVLTEGSATSAAGMVADLAACHEKVSSRVQACLDAAESNDDDFTVDLMVRRLGAHGKADWMLRSTLGDEPAAPARATTRPAAKAATPAKAVKPAKKAKAKTKKAEAPKSPVKSVQKPATKAVAAPKTGASKSAQSKPAPAANKKKSKVAMG